MRRPIALLAAVMMTFSLSACGTQRASVSQTEENETISDPSSAPEQTMGETSVQSSDSGSSDTGEQAEGSGHMETAAYSITYDGNTYEKEASVYVPAAYDGSTPMNILYLLHGSTGSGEQLGEAMQPLLDQWMADGTAEPALVVFPTYYPDRSFVTSDYSQDYPLNHFFAEEEILTLMQTVESRYHTYAESTDEAGLEESRRHRAFGGYSMGGVTTWDVLALDPQYFAYFLPMAGDCWLDRAADAESDEQIADLLAQGLLDHGLTADDFRVMAMVGGSDGTKYSMQPQIAALHENYADLFTQESLTYWENEGGGHSQASLEAEMEHAVPDLWNLPE